MRCHECVNGAVDEAVDEAFLLDCKTRNTRSVKKNHPFERSRHDDKQCPEQGPETHFSIHNTQLHSFSN